MIRPDGSGQRQVVAGLPSIDTIAWSPDSSKLAFVGTVIGIVPREGGAVSYSKPAQSPLEWRPNGIFYNCRDRRLRGYTQCASIPKPAPPRPSRASQQDSRGHFFPPQRMDGTRPTAWT